MGLERLAMHIEAEALVYERLPYRPSLLFPRARLSPARIAEVLPQAWPPMVLTRDGEFLPVSAAHKDALIAFAQRHGLPLVEREDVWEALLDPFLDTEHGPEWEAANLALLARSGLEADAVSRLRARLEPRMLAWTARTWEWQYYGLFDALDAMGQLAWPPSFRAFYWEAMALARRGRRVPGPRLP